MEPGGLYEEFVELVLFALDLDAPMVDDMDEDAGEDGPVDDLLEAVVGFLVGLSWRLQEREGVVEGFGDVIDLGDGLSVPAVDLGLFGGDALLFGLQDLK